MLSMELYCAAVLEGNARARFVGVVSALEPLAIQDSLGDRVADFVDESIGRLATVDVADDVRQSLAGRVRELKRESVRQALRRLCGQWFPGRRSAWDAIDRAYRLRSQLVHDGVLADADIDLGVVTEKVGAIIRAIYEQSARHPFWVKPTLPD